MNYWLIIFCIHLIDDKWIDENTVFVSWDTLAGEFFVVSKL